jgi:hypothetical protein
MSTNACQSVISGSEAARWVYGRFRPRFAECASQCSRIGKGGERLALAGTRRLPLLRLRGLLGKNEKPAINIMDHCRRAAAQPMGTEASTVPAMSASFSAWFR